LGDGIHRNVLDLEEFNFTELDFTHPNASFKENGVQFINMDYSNKTFKITEDFITQCIKAIENNELLIDNDKSTKIEVNFKNCKFSNFIIKDQNIKADILFDYDEKSNNLEIAKFIILDSTLGGKFYINKQYSGNNQILKIDSFKIENTNFKENFKLHHTNLSEFNIEDTDFNKHADFFKSKFFKGILIEDKTKKINSGDIGFKAINFKGLALFGDTEFYKKLIVQYVTFESFSHFRKAKLHGGLDLDYSNIQNEMNFFDVEKLDTPKAKNNTSQETYRIIKHNFEKIGNKIEANQYHVLELSKNRKNIWSRIWSSEKFSWTLLQRGIVSLIHLASSGHSSSWMITLFWILVVGLTTNYYLCGYIKLDTIFKYISIITKMDDFHSDHIVFLLNKVSLGYLYYQFLTSIRKDTRE